MKIVLVIVLVLVALAIYDMFQRKHTIRRNFPLVGRLRYYLEKIGPELRQYIVTSSTDERPFSRNERRWIYASSKQENDMFGFGTDNRIEEEGHLIIKHKTFPVPAPEHNAAGGPPDYHIPCAKILGAARGRAKAFRPQSVINISGMSYGALSGPAVEAMNEGSKIAGCLHNTGEGGFSKFHRTGADMVFQIGTGYFGCQDENGKFSLPKLIRLVEKYPQIRAIEIKLSQGAKPGLGGTLPGAKVTAEIAEARDVKPGITVKSPNHHSAFSNVDEMIDLIEKIAKETGLPVGIKSAVGELEFWELLAKRIQERSEGPDFITIDGGEGGTGAAPLVYSDHVSLPFLIGFPRVYRLFAKAGLQDEIVFIGSGRLGLPYRAVEAFALGCDMISVAREAMIAVGCIQAQKCHTNHCPTGVATHQKWLVRGFDKSLKSARCANYILSLRRELLSIARTCGHVHPALISLNSLETVHDRFTGQNAMDSFEYDPTWALPSESDQTAVLELMQQGEVHAT